MIQATGQASWADSVWVETFEYTEGQHITSCSSVNLDMKWGCSLTAGTCRQLNYCICFITPWGMDIIYHNLLWVSISCGSTTDCINEQFIICGCFLCIDHSASSGYGWYISLYNRELSHPEGCGPHLHLWHQFYHLCQGGGCGSQVGIWTSHAVAQLEVHSLVKMAYHHGISVSSAQSCCIWSIWNPLWGSLFCQLDAVACNWGNPWRVQVVCYCHHPGWCRLLSTCHGRLRPQVWNCGRLVLELVWWWSGPMQCQLAC